MGQLTAGKIIGALKGLFSGLDVADQTLINSTLLFDQIEAHVSDGGTAATAQTETFVYQNTTPVNQAVQGVTVTFPIAVTGNDTNNAVVTVTKRDATGLNPLVVATLTTNVASGGGVAFLPKAVPLTPANIIVPPLSTLTVLVSKTAAGVAISAATSQARVQIQLLPSD